MKIPTPKQLLKDLCIALVMTGALTGAAFAQQDTSSAAIHPLAGPNRPANVPDGFVVTPFGFFHPSCVQSLAAGESRLQDGRIQHADGRVDAAAAVCAYPHYLRNGTMVTAKGVKSAPKPEDNTVPQVNGWIEDENVYTGSATQAYGALVATWNVPAKPKVNIGQVVYFFPGFEDAQNTLSILQPVLRYFNGLWDIASWNCCQNGITTNSQMVRVTSGDTIYGSITNSCGAGVSTCPNWSILTLDMTTGKSTTLNTVSSGQTFNLAQGGVLEAYGMNTCNDYPSDGKMSFENITVFDQNLMPIASPAWNNTTFDTVFPGHPEDTPQCSYATSGSKGTVALSY